MISVCETSRRPAEAPHAAAASQYASINRYIACCSLPQMKSLLQQNFPQARQIMVNNPQLTKALFQVRLWRQAKRLRGHECRALRASTETRYFLVEVQHLISVSVAAAATAELATGALKVFFDVRL